MVSLEKVDEIIALSMVIERGFFEKLNVNTARLFRILSIQGE